MNIALTNGLIVAEGPDDPVYQIKLALGDTEFGRLADQAFSEPMTYIKDIIDQVNNVTGRCGRVLLFGENIDTGSRISGLARGLKVNSSGRILNVGNCELTHCGVGMGIMLDHGNSVLFMKQLDFLLLGIDQLANTFNFVRAYHSPDDLGSFTIFLIVCDQGFQGPQSSMNSAGDVASLANVNVFCLNASSDAAVVLEPFREPGFPPDLP